MLNTSLVKKSLENTAEFILKNHPLDCPVCDQGSICDLQNINYKYGAQSARYFNKKIIKKKFNIHSLVRTSMIKCINCTKCIRFSLSLGRLFLGLLKRSRGSKIFNLEPVLNIVALSAGMVNTCPVGWPTVYFLYFVIQVECYYLADDLLNVIRDLIEVYNQDRPTPLNLFSSCNSKPFGDTFYNNCLDGMYNAPKIKRFYPSVQELYKLKYGVS